MISEEEKKELEELKSLLYRDSITQYGKRKLINLYENLIEIQNKMIELMAKQINEQNDILYDYDNSISYLPCNADVPMNKCLKGECKNCIIEYFKNKAKESE